jgi:hypothetical protein
MSVVKADIYSHKTAPGNNLIKITHSDGTEVYYKSKTEAYMNVGKPGSKQSVVFGQQVVVTPSSKYTNNKIVGSQYTTSSVTLTGTRLKRDLAPFLNTIRNPSGRQ